MGCIVSQARPVDDVPNEACHCLPEGILESMSMEDLALHSPKYRKGSVKHQYKFGHLIAEGGFAKVLNVVHKKNLCEYACKVIPLPHGKAGPRDMSRENIFREVTISASLDHKNVVSLFEFYYDKKKVYMIFEKMSGGRLLEVVQMQPSEQATRRIFRNLIEGIAYLHSKQITHRDLKLENILLKRSYDLESIQIADFGLAKKSSEPLKTMCGTLHYVAPEIIRDDEYKTYSKAVDMWSAGVLLYLLLSGMQPFGETHTLDRILHADYGFDKPQWSKVSAVAKNLVCKLLEISSEKRLTASQVLEHEFMRSGSTRDLQCTNGVPIA